MKLREECKRRRFVLQMSNHAIAEQANLPVGSVNKFFSSTSKAPSIYTVVPICKVLGVSLDEVFGISSDKAGHKEKDLLEEMVKNATNGIKVRNHLLAILSVCLVMVIIYAIVLTFT